MSKLWVVMPVYNEQDSIESVAMEWLSALQAATQDFSFCILNDGSKDSTLAILNRMAPLHRELIVVDKPNSGHGQTCIEGYRRAIAGGATWIFQIDSDGQCDPRYFNQFWALRDTYPLIFGYRRRRDDGFFRFVVSRILTSTVFLATGAWIKDLNVPYRLMKADKLKAVVSRIPRDFDLANVLAAVLLAEKDSILWLDIRFRQRLGGAASSKISFFARKAIQLWKQLVAFKNTRTDDLTQQTAQSL